MSFLFFPVCSEYGHYTGVKKIDSEAIRKGLRVSGVRSLLGPAARMGRGQKGGEKGAKDEFPLK